MKGPDFTPDLSYTVQKQAAAYQVYASRLGSRRRYDKGEAFIWLPVWTHMKGVRCRVRPGRRVGIDDFVGARRQPCVREIPQKLFGTSNAPAHPIAGSLNAKVPDVLS